MPFPNTVTLIRRATRLSQRRICMIQQLLRHSFVACSDIQENKRTVRDGSAQAFPMAALARALRRRHS